MTASNHPKRVVILDAENPLVEIQGEFFWREDHDALVAAAREVAFREGYTAGHVDAARKTTPQTFDFRRRPTLLGRLHRLVVGMLLLLMLLVALATVGEQLLTQR